MARKPKKLKFPSELRLDLASRDWVVIATGRARRLETFQKERRKKRDYSKDPMSFLPNSYPRISDSYLR